MTGPDLGGTSTRWIPLPTYIDFGDLTFYININRETGKVLTYEEEYEFFYADKSVRKTLELSSFANTNLADEFLTRYFAGYLHAMYI